MKNPATQAMLGLAVSLLLLHPTTGCSSGGLSSPTLPAADAPRTGSTTADDQKDEGTIRILPTIPWASDYAGSHTPAGSGRPAAWGGSPAQTRIVKVTTLDDYCYRTEEPIEGSLRWAIEEVPGPKTIVFEVGGTIRLKSRIFFTHTVRSTERKGVTGLIEKKEGGKTTIAGQTAPHPGITIRDYGLNIGVSDVLIQHLRIRPGDDGLSRTWSGEIDDAGKKKERNSIDKSRVPDPITVPKEVTGIILDHLSLSWGGDMNLQLEPDECVVMNCIISEALGLPLHPVSHALKDRGHSKGLFYKTIAWFEGRPERYAAVLNNLFAHNEDRNPLFAGSGIISNNVVFDHLMGIRIGGGMYKVRGTGTNDGNQGVPTADASIGIPENRVRVSIVGNHLTETAHTIGSLAVEVGNNISSVYLGNGNDYPANYFDGKLWDGENPAAVLRRLNGKPWDGKNPPQIWDPDGTADIEQLSRFVKLDQRFGTNATTGPDVPPQTRASEPPNWPAGYCPMTAAAARAYVLKNAGAFPAFRDIIDKRIVRNVREGIDPDPTRSHPTAPDRTNAHLWPADNKFPYVTVEDMVGRGNVWPDPTPTHRALVIPEHPMEIRPSGYTRLEEWLHAWSQFVEGRGPGPDRPDEK
ncbi:MAG TPA: hypothetical protein VMW24_01865 [Sedimentisphaerales bacterium]|nr:hypothetical protein [Sedimentisphaerales bacterium]